MKTLQLKKYLLVEPENPVYLTVSESGLFYADPESHESELIEGKFKFLCMGEEFEKDQKTTRNEACVLGQILTVAGFDCFRKEVEEAGYYWGENPVKRPDLFNYHIDTEGSSLYNKRLKSWHEANARTFNPSKTKIYQVIS